MRLLVLSLTAGCELLSEFVAETSLTVGRILIIVGGVFEITAEANWID